MARLISLPKVDFQVCNYATPAIDLIYAMYHFLSAENRQTKRAEFIKCYHDQFVKSLNEFGYMKTPPSLIDVQVELLRHGNLEVMIAICNAVAFYMDFTKMTAEDFDMGEGTHRSYKRLYNSSDYKQMILKELPRFLHNGFI
jgi:Ecdysteroid kinase-like family